MRTPRRPTDAHGAAAGTAREAREATGEEGQESRPEAVPTQVLVRQLPVGLVPAAERPEVAEPFELGGQLSPGPGVHLPPVRPRSEAVERRLHDWHRGGHGRIVVRPGEMERDTV